MYKLRIGSVATNKSVWVSLIYFFVSRKSAIQDNEIYQYSANFKGGIEKLPFGPNFSWHFLEKKYKIVTGLEVSILVGAFERTRRRQQCLFQISINMKNFASNKRLLSMKGR